MMDDDDEERSSGLEWIRLFIYLTKILQLFQFPLYYLWQTNGFMNIKLISCWLRWQIICIFFSSSTSMFSPVVIKIPWWRLSIERFLSVSATHMEPHYLILSASNSSVSCILHFIIKILHAKDSFSNTHAKY